MICFWESPQEGEKDQLLHRASFLRELLAPLPKESLHAGKRLIGIKETDSGVEVTFQDGTTNSFEGVIGADGIFSSVRGYVLQDAADIYAATPAGFWNSRVLVPYDKAVAALGEEHFKLDRQYGWIGDKAL